MGKNEYSAFTIMELLIVVIIIGIIAGFAIPNYNKSVARAYEQDALMQLSLIHAVEETYSAKEGAYWPPGISWPAGPSFPTDQINANLHTNIIENGIVYSCSPLNGGGFRCTAERTDTTFRIKITNGNLFSNGGNPCCDSGSGTCPTLPGCV